MRFLLPGLAALVVSFGFATAGGAPAKAGSQVVVPPTAPASSERDVEGRAALQRSCSGCHGLDPIVTSLRTRDEWDDMFQLMVEAGASGSRAQLDTAFDYVVRHYSKINVNTASAADLAVWLDDTEAAASLIVAFRQQNGPFKTLDDLLRVPGVDVKKLEARKQRAVF